MTRSLQERPHRFWHVIGAPAPRSFIGWSTVRGGAALYFNQSGQHQEALELLAPVLAEMSDDDRKYVMNFLVVDLQAAYAEAGLGRTEAALARLDHLLALHGPTQHPLTLGLVHEMRARIAFFQGRRDIYEQSARETTHWLRATGTPTLVARCDRLEHLGTARASAPRSDLIRLSGYIATGISTNDTTSVAKRHSAGG